MKIRMLNRHALFLFVFYYVFNFSIVRSRYILLRVDTDNYQSSRVIGAIGKESVLNGIPNKTISYADEYSDFDDDYGESDVTPACKCSCSGCTPKGCSGIKGRSLGIGGDYTLLGALFL